MSLHVINEELEAKLSAQRRNSTIASIVIGILLMVLLALLFWSIGIKIFSQKIDPIVSYTSEEVVEEVVEKQKVTKPTVKKVPASPSSSAVPVVTAMTSSSFSVPTPEVEVESFEVDFGESEGFGDGWGGGFGSGFESGAGAGAFSFMGEKMSGERVCFVIDYSASMKGRRIELLKEELDKAISNLPDGVDYQLIFFAGPVWLAGDTVPRGDMKSNHVVHNDKTYSWSPNRKFGGWAPDKDFKVEWQKSTRENRKETSKWIKETELVFGTDWKYPLEKATSLMPRPDLIVFLTDGLAGNAIAKAEHYGDVARKRKIKINTIALMEPKAREALEILAAKSGGQFSLIDKDGNKIDQEGKVIRKKGGIKKRE